MDDDREALKEKLKLALAHAGCPADLLAHVDEVFASGTKEAPKKAKAPESEEEEEEPEVEPIPDEEEDEPPPAPKAVKRGKRRY